MITSTDRHGTDGESVHGRHNLVRVSRSPLIGREDPQTVFVTRRSQIVVSKDSVVVGDPDCSSVGFLCFLFRQTFRSCVRIRKFVSRHAHGFSLDTSRWVSGDLLALRDVFGLHFFFRLTDRPSTFGWGCTCVSGNCFRPSELPGSGINSYGDRSVIDLSLK